MVEAQKPDRFVLLDGANELSGPRSLLWVIRRWPKLRREMTSAGGYITHRLWYVAPLTLGLTTWWKRERDAYRFAHMPVHLSFWSWGRDGRHTRGGWLAVYRYEHGGPLWGNGVESLARDFEGLVPPPSCEPARPPPSSRRPRRTSPGP